MFDRCQSFYRPCSLQSRCRRVNDQKVVFRVFVCAFVYGNAALAIVKYFDGVVDFLDIIVLSPIKVHSLSYKNSFLLSKIPRVTVLSATSAVEVIS